MNVMPLRSTSRRENETKTQKYQQTYAKMCRNGPNAERNEICFGERERETEILVRTHIHNSQRSNKINMLILNNGKHTMFTQIRLCE